jgi:hypothetical protein
MWTCSTWTVTGTSTVRGTIFWMGTLRRVGTCTWISWSSMTCFGTWIVRVSVSIL